MLPRCRDLVQAQSKRPLTAQEVQGIEDRVRVNLKLAAMRDRSGFLAMTPEQRLQLAAKMAAEQLVAEANKKKQRLGLAIAAHDRLDTHLGAFAGPKVEALERSLVFVSDGKSNFMSAETRSNAVRANALRQLIDTFEATDPRFFGLFENAEGVKALTLEIFGKDSGNAIAKKGAAAWREVTAAMRQHFNDVGGKVGALEDWGLPQHHSQMKVAKAGKDKWAADTLPRLNRNKYVREDGRAMTDAEVTDFLGHAWETIATGGLNKLEAGSAGTAGGSMRANNGSQHRQIHFLDADQYLEYQQGYGERDLYSVLIAHVSQASKDIAMVETFGPNPDATYRMFRDKAVQVDAVADPAKAGKAAERAVKLDGVYNFVAGHNPPVASEWLARGFDTLRNWLVASRLGSAVITSLSDEATLYLTAHVNNLPEMQLFRNEVAALNPANPVEKRLARRAGLSLDTLIGDLNRFGQDGLGSTFSSKVASTTMRISGLNAMTDARKRAFGVTMMDAIGSLTREHASLKGLDPHDNRLLLAKGITDTDWSVWRLAEPEAWGGNGSVLTPEAIMRVSDDQLKAAGLPIEARREAVHKLLGSVLEETDVAVITPGAKERAMLGGTVQRGTWKGELMRSFFLFKSFPISMITRHWMRGMGQETAGGKAAYIASLIAATTVMGAAAMEINDLLSGKNPRNLNPVEGKGGAKNWLAAMLKGGSLGIYGDFLFSEATQGGNRSMLATLQGPVFGLAEEAIGLTQGNLTQLAQGKDTHAGAELVRFIRGNTPGANLWYAKAALDHLVFHQLQEYFSPGYMGQVQRRAQREFGQSFWWKPGAGLDGIERPDLTQMGGAAP